MTVFVDTSALYALIAPEDRYHRAAFECFERLNAIHTPLLSTNYILLECGSLLQARHGVEPAKTFLARAAQMLDVIWISREEHEQTIALWTKANSRNLSLVDCSSIAVMRQRRLTRVVTFDAHFAQAGFEMLPQADRVSERRAVYRAAPGRR